MNKVLKEKEDNFEIIKKKIIKENTKKKIENTKKLNENKKKREFQKRIKEKKEFQEIIETKEEKKKRNVREWEELKVLNESRRKQINGILRKENDYIEFELENNCVEFKLENNYIEFELENK